jgi:SAM-dependent methyltransferase
VQGVYAADIDRFVAASSAPVLQIGSRSSVLETKARNWRNLFQNKDFIGLDLFSGDNVDAVGDIAGDLASLRAALGRQEFATILCPHVLEHVAQPWVAAANIAALLAPGGVLLVQVPWVQAYHPFPEDYWRFSFAGIRALFAGLEIVDQFYCGAGSDVVYRVLHDGKPASHPDALVIESQLFQILLSAEANRSFLANLPQPRLALSRGYLPVTMVNAVLRKPHKTGTGPLTL